MALAVAAVDPGRRTGFGLAEVWVAFGARLMEVGSTGACAERPVPDLQPLPATHRAADVAPPPTPPRGVVGELRDRGGRPLDDRTLEPIDVLTTDSWTWAPG